MENLIFLLNHPNKSYFWVICDESGALIEKGKGKSLKDIVSQKKLHNIEGFIFSPLLSNKKIEVPPAKKSQILESIPYLLEDNILGEINDYHFVMTSRNERGEVNVSLIPKTFMDNEINNLYEEGINIDSLSLLDTGFQINNSDSFLVIFKEFSIFSRGSEWGWCSETETILSTLKKSLDEFNCTSLNVYKLDQLEDIDWQKYIQSEVNVNCIEVKDELDFLEKALPFLGQNLNILQNQYAPRIDWKALFTSWKYVLATTSLVIVLYFLQISLDIYQNNALTSELKEKSKSLFYADFPEELQSNDIQKALKDKLRNLNFSESEPFLKTVQNLTQVISNNERVSLFSINYDMNRNQFIVEIQCSQFEDLEAVKSTFLQRGYQVEVGSSKRVGNSILSEIVIKKS
tara:strand:- start:1547 stop:2755 length:1209 start_codon:yes stop_codon:yes gene_type:complete